MMRDCQLAIGDVCGDPTGLRVKVEDVDIPAQNEVLT